MRRLPNNQELTWFLELYRNNNLDLNPPYQRKSVWSIGERTYFLDTIFKDYPCPPIFLHKTIDDTGKITYHVVDGKQRLETVIMFTEDKLSIANDFGDTNLNGKKWSELTSDYRKKFWNYLFSVEFLNEIEESVLSEIFDRFNRNAKKLNDQELRHAKYTGWFVTEVENETEKQEWKDFGIATTANARRMRDAQFISELFLVILEGKIVGFNQDYLDEKYAEYDEPTTTHPDFSETDFTETKEKVKKIISEINRTNNSISKYAKTFIHYYTLWGLIALNLDRITNIPTLAKNYDKFMAIEEEIAKADDPTRIVGKSKQSIYKDAFDYYQNARGANTDLKQRQKRLDILIQRILNE